MSEERSRITVTPDGPYEVSGELPITPKRILRSPDGESLAWDTSAPLPHESPTYLCRCGQSGDKPFCDGTHEKVGFDGTETASVAPFSEVQKTYEGTGIKVNRVGSICEHAAFCVNNVTDWYKMLPDTSDVGIRTQVIGMIEHCPSGALVYELDDEVVEPDLPRAVSPVEDGALWVTGGVAITRSDGVAMEPRNRVTLCRCGQSNNKPLCDGTHYEIDFVAKAPAVTSTPVPQPAVAARRLPPRHMVLGVSESSAREVFEVAATVAQEASMTVSVVVVGTEGEVPTDARLRLRDMASTTGLTGPGSTWESTPGDPADALVEAGERHDSSLIVVERGGDHLAKLPHRVAVNAPSDMIVVAAQGAERTPSYHRVLIATDGSATADRAAKKGFDFARIHDAAVELVFVGHPATGELIVADTIEVFGQGVETNPRLLRGDPVEQILTAAEDAEADLLVVGNKGMRRMRMLLATSVPGAVLDGARCDVLLCRTVRQIESDLSPGEGGIIERHGEAFAAYVDAGGELHLMSAHCPHLGCLVEWNPTDEMFDCPCHGSRFTPQGDVVDGPATKPLRPARED